jgi:hypothetical protein
LPGLGKKPGREEPLICRAVVLAALTPCGLHALATPSRPTRTSPWRRAPTDPGPWVTGIEAVRTLAFCPLLQVNPTKRPPR